MSKIKKAMSELEDLKRINRELIKIYQEHEQNTNKTSTVMRPPTVVSHSSPIRCSSVASSTSLNFAAQRSQASKSIDFFIHSCSTISIKLRYRIFHHQSLTN